MLNTAYGSGNSLGDAVTETRRRPRVAGSCAAAGTASSRAAIQTLRTRMKSAKRLVVNAGNGTQFCLHDSYTSLFSLARRT